MIYIKTSRKMSAVPQGAFASIKIKQTMKSEKFNQAEDVGRKKKFRNFFPIAVLEQPLFNYSSKLMNSIWGLYNQYSVHNLKKNTDGDDFAVFNNQCL